MLSYNKIRSKCIIRDGIVRFSEDSWNCSHDIYERYCNGEKSIIVDYYRIVIVELRAALRERGVNKIKCIYTFQDKDSIKFDTAYNEQYDLVLYVPILTLDL